MSDEEEYISEEEEEEKKDKKEFVEIKSYTDIQRMKLEKLMANPDKPVGILWHYLQLLICFFISGEHSRQKS